MIRKVLLLTHEYPPHVYGGAGVHVEYLSRALARLVHVDVRCFGNQDKKEDNLTVRGFGTAGTVLDCPAHLKPVFEAARRCVDFNALGTDADVVHCHTWYSHLGGILARLDYGIPLVITAHSLEPLRPWKREQLDGGYDFSLWVEKTAIELADAVVAVSSGMRRDILDHFKVDEQKVKIIYNGIDTAEYRPVRSSAALSRYGIDPGKPYLLFVGRITRQKGIIHLVHAIPYLKSDCQVVLCAGAPDTPEIAAEMEAAVAEISSRRPGVVWIREMVDKASVIELYSHAAVFCCPSVYEPFGIINLEAMACEVPVVATAVGGIPEIVVEGETGFLVPAPAPDAPQRFPRDLADRIDRLMADPALRRRFGRAGRSRAESRFNWNIIAEQTFNLYAQLKPHAPTDPSGRSRPSSHLSQLSDGRRRAVIESVTPELDSGRYPIKRITGDLITVRADIFPDGHDVVRAVLLHRNEGQRGWSEDPMQPLVNDRWEGNFQAGEPGLYFYTIMAWVDHFRSWRRDMIKKIEAGIDLAVDYLAGANLIESAAQRAGGEDARMLGDWATQLRQPAARLADRRQAALREDLWLLADRYPDRQLATVYDRELAIVVDRPKARFSSWYEFFPRSCAAAQVHATWSDCEARIDYVADLGFDVIYLPPIHPIGRTHRKGKNNTPSAGPDDAGSPWAIGADEGGHTSIHPRLGTLADFRSFVRKAAARRIEVALDIAFQCSPDHPAVREHPDWFLFRPDGSLQYAENPPKKYEDIYPFNFESPHWRELWEYLKRVFLFWAEEGIRIFRVDNPHTKPFAFWEWVIREIKQEYPDVIFLAEAFTRPKVMRRLAKLGFSMSYTYFAWRNTKTELTEYFTELTRPGVRDYFRPCLWPNTPDILTAYLQHGGRAAFLVRLILAATLGANYGIYGPAFELCESRPREPDSEEYLNSEKYEIRSWDLDHPGSLRSTVARMNAIRAENPALQSDESLRFHESSNEQILCYSKHTADFRNVVVTVVNLDPHHVQEGWVELNFDRLVSDATYEVHELLTGTRFLWQGRRNYVSLSPQSMPANVFLLRHQMRREHDFDYYM